MRDGNTSNLESYSELSGLSRVWRATNSSTCRRKANKKQVDCLRELPRGSALAHFHLRESIAWCRAEGCVGVKSLHLEQLPSWSLHPQGIRLQLELEKVEHHENLSKKCRGFCAQPDYKSSVDGGINTFRHGKNLPPLHLFLGSYCSMCFSQQKNEPKNKTYGIIGHKDPTQETGTI